MEILKYLVDEQGIDINERNEQTQRTILHVAAIKERETCVAWLVASGADRDACDHNHLSPLMYVCSHGHPAAVRMLLRHGCDPHFANTKGETALYHACSIEVH